MSAINRENIQGCKCLNPWNYEMSCKTGAVAATVVALAAITAVTGFLAILASSGLSVAPFNVLSSLTVAGGGALAGTSSLVLITALIWLITKSIQVYQKSKTIHQPKPPVRQEESSPERGLSPKPMSETEVFEHLQLAILEKRDISTALKTIPSDFFTDKSQERAKYIFSKAMIELLGSKVDFPKAPEVKELETLSGTVDSEVFKLSVTSGVEFDIPRCAKDSKRRHVFQAASQYNAAEAPSRYTPGVGEAMIKSAHDHTQGPLAQRTNPIAFELVTAFLTHLGFNMLDKVLPSAGKTYMEGAPIQHGYLCPKNKNIGTLTKEFKNNYAEAEYVCYESKPGHWGHDINPVHIFLQAAPAIGYSFGLTKPTDELQKHVALANYLALFNYGIELAKKSGKPVVLHATAVGGGVFGNTTKNLQWGFKQAALALQDKMKVHNVCVQLEAYKGSDVMAAVAKNLKLKSV